MLPSAHAARNEEYRSQHQFATSQTHFNTNKQKNTSALRFQYTALQHTPQLGLTSTTTVLRCRSQLSLQPQILDSDTAGNLYTNCETQRYNLC